MTATEILLSGNALQVDLLTEVPDSTLPANWKIASWPGYQPLVNTPVIAQNQGGTLTGYIFGPLLPLGQVAEAAVVSFAGQAVMFALIEPVAVPLGLLTISFVVQPWFAGAV